MDKKEIRNNIKNLKKALTPDEINCLSIQVLEKLYESDEYKDADVIYSYYSYNSEVLTSPLMTRAWEDGKKVAVPLVVGERMKFIRINSHEDVTPGYMGIPEPKDTQGEECSDSNVLMIMPGIAFDRSFNRIGYGGGFYDRYLSDHRNVMFTKVALCYDFQIVDEALPVEEFDEPVDVIISPLNYFKRK